MTVVTEAPDVRKRRTYFRSTTGVRLPHDQASRQGKITHLAFQLLGRDEAIAFLNAHHASLRGRPLDIATADSAGFMSVESTMRHLAAQPAGPEQ